MEGADPSPASCYPVRSRRHRRHDHRAARPPRFVGRLGRRWEARSGALRHERRAGKGEGAIASACLKPSAGDGFRHRV